MHAVLVKLSAIKNLCCHHYRVSQVVHLVPPELAASAAYRRWAASLPGQQLHPPNTASSGFAAATRMLAKLNLVSSRVFPLPRTAISQLPSTAQQSSAPAAEARSTAAAAAPSSGSTGGRPSASADSASADEALRDEQTDTGEGYAGARGLLSHLAVLC